ncbi:nucleotidyltransferase domain-containing protein [Parachryseolinea silvisoli]|uniref:nucleotidyltransferase domain-containing protein n=1 Tax=Parachryseolinea silvisoli TaxID=2873601 RepID=UPI002265A119|nr:nucleotidyltransferase domain-containing protein [Parachryseolinea silvisoli]MCD9016579.1 nucleotidyltransferase domain-containing protein [Parachryseolinea silvisoli]
MMKEVILNKLKDLEQQFDVKILLACESGSRAWGFASPDSDYDARFIYVHKKDFYLSIDERPDVLGLPVDAVLDIGGWELRKALRLFRKANAPLYEWLQSPLVYTAQDNFVADMKELMPQYFSPRAAMHHYLSMAKGVVEYELAAPEVRLKKYFYALRPILAARWIAERGTVPPIMFAQLRASLPAALNDIVDDLLRQKAIACEGHTIVPVPALNQYLLEEVKFLKQAVPPATEPVADSEPLHTLFRKYVV